MSNALMAPARLLGPRDPFPYGTANIDTVSPFLLICDHAGNAVPAALRQLGLPPEELDRHIGIDIGALNVALSLAARIDAPLLYQRYSRLVIDTNRQAHADDSIPAVSDGTVIPGNAHVSEADRFLRRSEIHEPYHAAIDGRIRAATAAGRPPIIVSIHSYTPELRSRHEDRPWPVALMFADDGRFGLRVKHALEAAGEGPVGINEPYAVNLDKDYSIPIHAHGHGLPYVEFEIRQDLIATPSAAEGWAYRLADCLETALADYRGAGA